MNNITKLKLLDGTVYNMSAPILLDQTESNSTTSAPSSNYIKELKSAILDNINTKASIQELEDIENILNNKANKSTTLSGYGITDTYTKTDIDTKLNSKANISHIHDDRYYTEGEMNTKLNAKMNVSGGTFTGRVINQKGYQVHNCNGQSGVAGYIKFISIKVNASYQNCPIGFEVYQRGRNPRGLLSIMFNNANNTDPGVASFYKNGNIYAWYHKSAASVYDIYIQKSEGYDDVTIVHWGTNYTQMQNVVVSFTNVLVSGLPSGAVAATASNF